MNCECGGNEYGMRHFLTKEEKVEMLQQYKKYLEEEARGVEERIKDLKKNN